MHKTKPTWHADLPSHAKPMTTMVGFLITMLLASSCAYYTKQELRYMEDMFSIASREYADAKTEEAIPRARVLKFKADGDSVHYHEAVADLLRLERTTKSRRQLMEEIRAKKDHIERNCCK